MVLCWGANKISWDWVSLLRSYRRYVTSSATVLEIGASTPSRTRELSVHCRQLIGVELMPERKPADFENVHYSVGDWQNLADFIAPDSIDVAISSHTIEHVPDDRKAINQLHVVLRSGGVALLNTPNRKRLSRAIMEALTGDRKFPYWEHQREYTEPDLRRLLAGSEFKRYEIYPVAWGLHGGPVFCYLTRVPRPLRRFAQFWEIHLFKD